MIGLTERHASLEAVSCPVEYWIRLGSDIDVSCAKGLSHLVRRLLRRRMLEQVVVMVRAGGLRCMIGRSTSHRCIVH